MLFCHDAHEGRDGIRRQLQRDATWMTYPTPSSMRRYYRDQRTAFAICGGSFLLQYPRLFYRYVVGGVVTRALFQVQSRGA